MTPTREGRRKPVIGLALGGGSARGWAHIGAIRALAEVGIRPDVVCGTSIGALVGAVYAHGDLDWFEEWVSALTFRQVVRMLDVRFSGGLLGGARLLELFGERFGNCDIRDLEVPFAAVATDLDSGREIWLQEGDTLLAVRASIAIPGLFTPVEREGVWLVDGGLVNPVPVSLARAMNADFVIAVDLNTDILTGWPLDPDPAPPEPAPEEPQGLGGKVRRWLADARSDNAPRPARPPSYPRMLTALEKAINIMQVRITRSRLAGEPPDVLIAPRLARIGLMEFHRAVPAIAEGRAAVERALPELRARLRLSARA